MGRFARHHAAAGTLALLFSLTACGKGAEQENQALASLDTRLTENALPDTGAGNTVPEAAQSVGNETGGAAPVTPAATRIAALAGRPVGGCAGRGLRYGAQWARAMPEGLGLYPGARLQEAAGTDTGRCALRVISFTTADSADKVVTHYARTVRAAGFDADRQPGDGEILLGGTRTGDDAAYLLFARPRRSGGAEVDIVARAGRPAA